MIDKDFRENAKRWINHGDPFTYKMHFTYYPITTEKALHFLDVDFWYNNPWYRTYYTKVNGENTLVFEEFHNPQCNYDTKIYKHKRTKNSKSGETDLY